MTMLATAAPTTLLLITADPSHPLAHLALRYARALLQLTVTATAASNEGDDGTDQPNSSNVRSSPIARSSFGVSNSPATSDNIKQPLNIFFYADAAYTANRLRWQSADQLNLTQQWQRLSEQYQLPLPSCVSTALTRGISDTDNSARHRLDGENLATGFHLVGLSELAMMMQGDCRLIQF
ncbi:sulfurtransferase complex subunit TusD [Psychrobacter sp. PL15]|uniref:sulfurtransferase complex subunit TusD n=1 Tax=Psychrobacter sp. PL15 TaxID=3071719 RepID=UPI002E1683AF